MTQKTFSELLFLTNSNSDEALLEILQRFHPLLNKYARKFNDIEEYYSQLQFGLINLVKNFPEASSKWNDAQIVAYIAKSIYTDYIKISKQFSQYESCSVEFTPEIINFTIEPSYSLYLKELFYPLTLTQRETLYLHYIQGLSIQEIAQMRNISRQAVNKIKNQALNILRNQFDI